MRHWLAAALLLLLGSAATAQVPERRMLDADEAAGFRAVGRLNVAGSRFCTATLISADVVVTAAHCLFHPRTNARVPDSELRFVAGLRLGESAAVRRVAATVVHPNFTFEGFAAPAGVQADLAVARLAVPVPAADAVPVAPGGVAADGAALAIVSYARDRAQAPSIEAPCRALTRIGEVVALDCMVNYGASGAPVLQGEDAEMRLVGVVSAMGRILATEADVTLAVSTADALPGLLEALDAAD